jgi:hypothetical protein
MAKVLGTAGWYVTEQSINKYQKQFRIIFLAPFCFVAAFSVASAMGYLPGKNLLVSVLAIGACVVSALFVPKIINRLVDKLERERLDFRKGAVGEAVVGHVLDNFPDDFHVIHDLATPLGNIDHVVIGPSGVYAIDTKNWKGVVTADGNGELLLNGKPTDKPEMKDLVRRFMSIKKRVKALSSRDPYVRGVFAFPSAHVGAKWGSTGCVHCLTDEQLYDYIVENGKHDRLSKKEIDTLSKAFLALTRMDKDFA